MAQLLIDKQIKDNVWAITFTSDPKKLSEADKELMKKFGEPKMNIGGVFLEDTGNEYTFPAKFINIFTDLPFTQYFDAKDVPFDTNTLTKVTAYKVEFLSRFDDSMTTLRASEDSFTAQELHTI